MELREELLAIDDRVIEAVKVPIWNRTLYVRSLTGEERDAFEDGCLKGKGKDRKVNLQNMRARLVALATCLGPDDPRPVFSGADVERLGRKSARALNALFDAAQRLSGITEEEVEELVGNSGTGPSAGSGSS